MSIQETNLTAIADAIRAKEGSTGPIPANDFAQRILDLETGGGPPDDVHTIALTPSNPEGGTVEGGGVASKGMTVTVDASAADGFTFGGWQEESGELASKDESYTFTVNRDRNLTAVFEGVEVSRLPEGYTEVEYIQSGSGQYLASPGFVASATAKVVMDVEPLPEATSGCFFGESYYAAAVNGTRYHYPFQMMFSSGNIYANTFKTGTLTYGTVINSTPISGRMTLTLDMPNKIAEVNEESIAVGAHTGTYQGVPLLARYYYSAKSGTVAASSRYELFLPAKIYSCQMYTNNAIVRDLVPCINPDGISGLYDLVGNGFYKSATSTPFVAGPDI